MQRAARTSGPREQARVPDLLQAGPPGLPSGSKPTRKMVTMVEEPLGEQRAWGRQGPKLPVLGLSLHYLF